MGFNGKRLMQDRVEGKAQGGVYGIVSSSNEPKNTTKKGEITEIMVLARLIQLGYTCLIPWGHDHRYDSAVDDDGRLVRVQCKTVRSIEGRRCLGFNTGIPYARVGGKPHIRKGYEGGAEYFGVYAPHTAKIYLIPVEDMPVGSKGLLRISETKNNQQQGVKWAQDYEIQRAGGRT